MLCALTVRKLEPDSFDEFRDAFMQGIDPNDAPPGMVRFNMVRNVQDPDEVICFGMFDGTMDELRALNQGGRDEQLAAIAPFVASVGADASTRWSRTSPSARGASPARARARPRRPARGGARAARAGSRG